MHRYMENPFTSTCIYSRDLHTNMGNQVTQAATGFSITQLIKGYFYYYGLGLASYLITQYACGLF